MPQKKKEQKKPVHRRRKTQGKTFAVHIFIGIVWIASLFALAYGVFYVTNLTAFNIETVEIQGGKTISHDEVREKVDNTLRGSYFLIIPKRFTYMYPHEAVVTAIEAVPRIKDVRVAKEDRNTLSVSFGEYLPHAVWCGFDENALCFFIDDTGYAFDESPFSGDGTLMRHTVEEREVSRGDELSPELFSMTEALSHRIEEELGFRIASVLYKTNGDMEFNVSGGGAFFVASGADPELTFENLEAVLTSEAYDHLQPGNFRYIDVRFEKKVFVNEVLEKESATSSEEVATSTQAEPNN